MNRFDKSPANGRYTSSAKPLKHLRPMAHWHCGGCEPGEICSCPGLGMDQMWENFRPCHCRQMSVK